MSQNEPSKLEFFRGTYMSTEKTVKLTSQEGASYDVPLAIAKMSVVVKNILDEDQDDDEEEDREIPLPNVKTEILAKVIEFARHHCQEAMSEIEKVFRLKLILWQCNNNYLI